MEKLNTVKVDIICSLKIIEIKQNSTRNIKPDDNIKRVKALTFALYTGHKLEMNVDARLESEDRHL